MRRLWVFLLALTFVPRVDGQIIRRRYGLSQPDYWVSLGIGYQDNFTIVPTSSGEWDFGHAAEFSGSIEKSVGSGVSLGITGSSALVPLRESFNASTASGDVRVSRAFANLHLAPGGQFHTVLEAKIGASFYEEPSNRVGPNLPPEFSFALGYGFGYAFSPRFSLDIVQDQTTSVHAGSLVSSNGESTSARIQTTKLIGRFGLGGR